MSSFRTIQPAGAGPYRIALAAFACVVFCFGVLPARAADPVPKSKDHPAVLQRMIDPFISFSTSVEPKQARPGETVTYTITATLKETFHVYAYLKENPAPPAPTPTQFDLFQTGDLEPVGGWVVTPEPERKADPNFENKVFGFHEGRVNWSHSFKVPLDAEPGERVLRTQIFFQICDANSCKPPTRKTLQPTTLTVVAGDGSALNTTGSSDLPRESKEDEAVVASSSSNAANTNGQDDERARSIPTSPSVGERSDTAGPEVVAAVEGGSVAAGLPAEPRRSSEVERKISEGLIPFLLFSALGGIAALIMPCVWPMVPVTVNFFVKQGQVKGGRTTALAVTYCLSIIGIFTLVGVMFSAFMEASSLAQLANNPWLNLMVAGVFIAFGLSLLGLFELRLPSFVLNASARGESHGGLVGVIFMALTLTITSFTCTFPVVGGLLVLAARGSYLYPILGLLTFATVVALPFFALALAPGMLQRMPRSGDWMNSVKVVGGLVEIGAALKFLNTAEIGLGATSDSAWFDAQVVLSSWVVLAAVCGLYLLGLFRTDHDQDAIRVGPIRLLTGAFFLFFAMYFAPALFGNPPESKFFNLFVGLMPPDVGELSRPTLIAQGEESPDGGEVKASSADPAIAVREEKKFHGVQWGMSYDQALARAKETGRPILIDFTGVNCANCRQMEREVMPKPDVRELLGEFVTVALYTDFVDISSIAPAVREQLALENRLLQVELTSDITTPLYVALSPDGTVLGARGGYIPIDQYKQFLSGALEQSKSSTASTANPDSRAKLARTD